MPTPRKINMEPENTPLEEENYLPMLIMFKFYVNLPGCTPLFLNGKFLQGPGGKTHHFRSPLRFVVQIESPLRRPHHTLRRWPHLLWIQGSLGPRVAGGKPPNPQGLRGSCLTGITSPLQTGGDYHYVASP